MNNIEGTIFEDYDSIIFDLDATIWEVFTSEGTSIGAYAMRAPFELRSGLLVKDIDGNYCKLQEGVRTLIKSLDANDMNLGIVSSGEKENTPHQAQPSVMLLKKFNLYKYFNLYVVCKRGINKREYVRPFGRTLFIDDDDENLEEVKVNKDVDVLDRKAFEDWDQLFQKKTSSLLLGLSTFLIKRAQEEFQYTPGVDILMKVYQAELAYTLINKKLKEGDEATDEENVKYLKAKQEIPRIFEDVIKYLREMLEGTIAYSKLAYDSVKDKEGYGTHHEALIPRFENALTYLNDAFKYIYDEGHWPQVFIAIDNVVNLMHGDVAYMEHMMANDEVDLQDTYEGYVKDKDIPSFEAEDNIDYHASALADKWDEFAQFLSSQGKSLEFNIESSQKLSWEIQPEEAQEYWINKDDMEDIFVMARDYPGNIARHHNVTFAEQLRHDEGYAYDDIEYDHIIIDTYTKEAQLASVLQYWQDIANEVGVTLRYKGSSLKLSWQIQQELKNGLNVDVEKRDHIIFGDLDVASSGGVKSFEISLQQLEELIAENFIDLKEQANNRPSTSEFLNFMKRFSEVKAIGFAVDLERGDYRTSLEGLKYIGNIDEGFAYTLKNAWEETADEFELTEVYFRAWWD